MWIRHSGRCISVAVEEVSSLPWLEFTDVIREAWPHRVIPWSITAQVQLSQCQVMKVILSYAGSCLSEHRLARPMGYLPVFRPQVGLAHASLLAHSPNKLAPRPSPSQADRTSM